MPKIDGIIATSNVELVRNRIASIIADELANQYTLTSNAALSATVAVGRTQSLNHTECPYVNVLLGQADIENQNQGYSDFICTFYIDCYSSSKATNATSGDILSQNNLLKLALVVRAILENPIYKTLDFSAGVVGNRRITGYQISPPSGDGVVIAHGRMTYSVKVSGAIDLLEADLIGDHVTQVNIGESEEGYTWSTDGGMPINSCDTLLNSLTTAQLNQCILPNYDFSDSVVIANLTEQQVLDLTDEFGDLLTALATADLTDGYNEAALLSNDTIDEFFTANAPEATVTLGDGGSTVDTFASGATGFITVERSATDITDDCTTDGEGKVVVPACPTIIKSSLPYQTGVTVSQVSGDDGDTQRGSGVSFFVLDHNNWFGNTNRFTDTLGGQTYADGIMLIHSMEDQQAETIYGLRMSVTSGLTFSQAIANAQATSIGSFTTGWFLPNDNELDGIRKKDDLSGNGGGYDYAPFSYQIGNIGLGLWTSTTPSTGNALVKSIDLSNEVRAFASPGNRCACAMRIFTKSELGL